jgi:hypothetical protein
LDANVAHLKSDVRDLVDTYRAIFRWDLPEVDETFSGQLIVQEKRPAA